MGDASGQPHLTVANIHLIGASGRSGAALTRALLAAGDTPLPIIRTPARWAATTLPGTPRVADLTNAPALRAALADAQIIVSCAHARHAPAILAAAPAAARFVFLGSTRKFTRFPDAHGNGVRAGEAAFLASGRAGVMLHPTMIYGAQGENNVQRLATLLRRLPLVPLPGGGRALVQPIHQADVTASLLAALARDWNGPHALVIAGPAPLPYDRFVRQVAYAAGIRPPPRIVPVPAALLMAGAMLTWLPGLPRVRLGEIRRLMEDKAFDVAPMREVLGVVPRGLAEGLALTFR
jgi:nucleoside-diphosphate-sugar epimerase